MSTGHYSNRNFANNTPSSSVSNVVPSGVHLVETVQRRPEESLHLAKSSFLQRLSTVFQLDLRSLSAFRIAFGLVILADLLIRFQDLRLFYTDEGVLPRSIFSTLSQPWSISLYLANGTWPFAAFLLGVTVLVCAAFIGGFRTKEASILLWLLVLSLQLRNELILQGGDGIVRCMLFWSMFLPLGEYWSIDARLNRAPRPQSRSLQVCSVATMCLVFQVAMIYFFAALMKTDDIWRVKGTALQYALSIDQFTNANGRFLLQYPTLLRLITFAVLGIEQYAIALLFLPWRSQFWRLVLVATFFSFHLGIAITMELGQFPYVCLAMWLLLLPPIFWEQLQRRFSSLGTQMAGDTNSAAAAHNDGEMNGAMRIVQSALLAFFILNVMQWNIRNLDLKNTEQTYPAKYDFSLALVGLNQNWGMFTPYPLNWDGWYLMSGKTKSGRIVNLSPGAAAEDPISDERPKEIWQTYGNERRRKYLMSLASYSSLSWRQYYVRAVALDWARKHPGDPLAEMDIVYFQEITLPDGSSTPLEKYPIWHSNAPEFGF